MKNENKSLFLYTSLIFVVSILMILIAFAGQNHIKIVRQESDSGTSLSERVNSLNEQNAKLTNENAALTQKIAELENTNTTNAELIESYLNDINKLNNEKESLTNNNNNLNNLLKIKSFLDAQNYEEAKKIYDLIDVSRLNQEQKLYYDEITLKLQQ